MTTLRRTASLALAAGSLALAAALTLLPATAVGQQESTSSPEPTPSAIADVRLVELEALIPEQVAGLSLTDSLQLATGEQLIEVMQTEEAELLTGLLEANGGSIADYAAAASLLPLTDDRIGVIQAHRISGLDAGDAIDTWIAILSLQATDAQVETSERDGLSVITLSDTAMPEAPPLSLVPLGDVVWMIWSDDQALVTAAIDAFRATAAEVAVGTAAG